MESVKCKIVEWEELKDWSTDDDSDIKYFSGTATYAAKIPVPQSPFPVSRLILDLGEVKNIATVTVNGKTFPVLWKPPYRLDITEAFENSGYSGHSENSEGLSLGLEIKVTNLWPNRLIGDDALSADAPLRPKAPRAKNTGVKSIPSFLREGTVPPSGRHTFSTWQHWTKEDKLLPSGILGPVRLEVIHPVSQPSDKRNG